MPLGWQQMAAGNKGVLYLTKIKGRNADFVKGLCKKKEM
jgi:hypothetical protein